MNSEEGHSNKMEEEKNKEVVPAVVDAEIAQVNSTLAIDATVPSSTIVPEEEEQKKTEVISLAAQEVVLKKVSEEENEVSSKDKIITKVYNYGSCEMDQFWLPGERSETRRPYLNSLMENIPIVQIACGSLHILLVSKEGLLYSSGLNDDGALGRPDESATDGESDKKSKLVNLPIRVNMISAGDSHSVAANSELGVCFQWGAYRNTEKSNLASPTRLSTEVGIKEFTKKNFKKVLSGSQHTLVLTTEGEVFGWGDPDLGVIGRAPRTRHGYDNALKVAKVTQHKAVDISTGGRHSFMKRAIKKGDTTTHAWYSWGLNNFGQLGLQLEEDAPNSSVFFEPTQMHFFDNLDVAQICGGESHSLALLNDGTVYAFGRNDIGQFGVGDTKSTHPIHGQIKEVNNKPLQIDTFPESAKKIEKIWSGPNYSYARDVSGQCFSWGFGSNFVLGNRKDENEDEYTPFSIPRDFFKNEEVPTFFSLGSQHATYLVIENVESVDIQVPKNLLLDAPVEYLPQNLRPSITALAKELKAAQATKKKEENDLKNKAKVEEKEDKEKANQEKKALAQAEKEKSTKETKQAKDSNVKEGTNKKKVQRSKSCESSSKNRATSKSKSPAPSKERKSSIKPVAASKIAQSKGKLASNKKKITEKELVKVSQAKNTKQIKKESAPSKKK